MKKLSILSKVFILIAFVLAVGLGYILYWQNRNAPVASSAIEKTQDNLMGEWQSQEDQKYVVRFEKTGAFTERYDDKVVDSGTWTVLTSLAGTRFAHLDRQDLYLKKVGGPPASKEPPEEDYYGIVDFGEDDRILSLIYLPRGNMLLFRKISR